ncbi:SCO2522 family protein [Streptomyces sp. NPDC048442]|uniref:SCO2522 family protein n=1 Tax=Streptomyces sp. NPDC048442 TaxID=3154823 RepID=UPI0034180BAC
MMESVFREETADPRTESLPLSHLSLELGHLYMEDFAAGPERLRAHFEEVRPWAEAARAAAVRTHGRRARVSTCFLVDDYFSRHASPERLLPMLCEQAEAAGVRIDYLVRESGCARAGEREPARAVEGRLVESPPPGSDGSRPPAREVGWLSNGQRGPSGHDGEAAEAMRGALPAWAPPSETGARQHSVFLDVELWSEEEKGERLWSCPFLAGVWQLLRLGMLRHDGAAVLRAEDFGGSFPADWEALPPLLRLTPRAHPFAAYRTFSVLPTRFLPVEHAVRVLLGQVHIEAQVRAQVEKRAGGEGLVLPPELPDRAHYAFTLEP